MKIGILALQGDFREHKLCIEKLGVEAIEVRTISELNSVDGLIIPGGESTTIGKLMVKYGLISAIKERYVKGMAIYGTCAGAILLAEKIVGSDQPRLGLIDIEVERNSYGRQVDSFETDLEVKGIHKKVHAIFIRAPGIIGMGKGIEVLAEEDKDPVMIRKDKILITTFHPELTDDLSVHKYFLDMVKI